MSRIDDLLAEFAPNGVEYRAVGELLEPISGLRGVKREHYGNGTRVPIIDQSVNDIAGYTDDAAIALPPGQYIVFGDHTRAVKWVNFEFAPGADGTKVLRARPDVDPKFAYYAVSGLDVASRGYNRHWTVLREMRIPLPPHPVQREIVRILDQFVDLERSLTAEWEARRTQYDHYRDSMIARVSQSAAWLPMGEAGAFFGGLVGKSKPDFGVGSSRYVPYLAVYSGIEIDVDSGELVTILPGERQNELRLGDVLLTGSSETREDVGMSSVLTNEPATALYLNSFCVGFRPHHHTGLLADYAKHLFRSSTMRPQLVAAASGVTRFNLSKNRLRSAHLPVPDTDEQRRIADALDALYRLPYDRELGLPAELAARRKQYEYYRDKLLTFPEAS